MHVVLRETEPDELHRPRSIAYLGMSWFTFPYFALCMFTPISPTRWRRGSIYAHFGYRSTRRTVNSSSVNTQWWANC